MKCELSDSVESPGVDEQRYNFVISNKPAEFPAELALGKPAVYALKSMLNMSCSNPGAERLRDRYCGLM